MNETVLAVLGALLATSALAETPPKPVKPDRIKPVCKVHAETGSLIARRKVCKTAAEWRQEADDIQNMNNNKVCSGSAACAGSPG